MRNARPLASSPHSLGQIELLEPRRLLNFAPFGAGVSVPLAGLSSAGIAADGSYIVAYMDGAVKLNRYSSTGEQIGQPVRLASGNSVTIEDVHVAMNPSGDAIVEYTIFNGISFTGTIYVNRISRTGAVSPRQTVKSEDFELLERAVVSIDDNGGYFIGWIDANYTPTLRAFDASGNPRGEEFRLDAAAGGGDRASHFTIAANRDGSGAVYAYYYSSDGHGSVNRLRYGRTSTTAEIGTARAIDYNAPSLSTFLDGSFVMAFQDSGSIDYVSQRTTVSYVQRFNADGSPRGRAVQLGTSLGGEGEGVFSPSVAAASNGSYAVAYYQTSDERTDTLYVQKFSRTDVSDDAGPVDIVVDASVAREFPAEDSGLGFNAAGDAVLTFTQIGESFSGYGAGVQRVTSSLAAIDHSTLYILGTRRADSISAKKRGGNVFAGLGPNSLKFAASRVTGIEFVGSNGSDRIVNETAIPSTIRGGSGNDIIDGGAGADVIRGNSGDDDMSGNDGNDTIIGDDGDDLLVGNDGNDSLDGGRGNDRLYGYRGNDVLFGGDGDDRFYGAAGADILNGGAGRDTAQRDDVLDDLISIEGSL